MARLVAVQPDVRHVMCAKRGRHSRFHFRPDHVHVVCVEFHIPGFDVDDAPVLPATAMTIPALMLMYGKVSQENYVELTAASAIPNKEIKSPQILRY